MKPWFDEDLSRLLFSIDEQLSVLPAIEDHMARMARSLDLIAAALHEISNGVARIPTEIGGKPTRAKKAGIID